MKKLTALLIVFLIIGAIAGIELFQTERKNGPKLSENAIESSLDSKQTSQPLTTQAENSSDTDQSEFQDKLEREFKILPTIDDLQQLSAEEVHFTPELIKEAGGVIGRIQDEAEKGPAKRTAAMHFFKKCAEDQEMVPAIRAVCLKKILKLIPVWQIPVALSDELISQDITDLAAKLP